MTCFAKGWERGWVGKCLSFLWCPFLDSSEPSSKAQIIRKKNCYSWFRSHINKNYFSHHLLIRFHEGGIVDCNNWRTTPLLPPPFHSSSSYDNKANDLHPYLVYICFRTSLTNRLVPLVHQLERGTCSNPRFSFFLFLPSFLLTLILDE